MAVGKCSSTTRVIDVGGFSIAVLVGRQANGDGRNRRATLGLDSDIASLTSVEAKAFKVEDTDFGVIALTVAWGTFFMSPEPDIVARCVGSRNRQNLSRTQ